MSLKRTFRFGTLQRDFTCSMQFRLLNRNGDTQEDRGNGGGVHARAFVLAVEQNFQLFLQVAGFAVLFRSFECIHRRPLIFSEFISRDHDDAVRRLRPRRCPEAVCGRFDKTRRPRCARQQCRHRRTDGRATRRSDPVRVQPARQNNFRAGDLDLRRYPDAGIGFCRTW